MKFLITGGSSIVSNIGDQAMIFTLVEYLKKRYPDSDIVLLDEAAYVEEAEKYTFRIIPDIPMNAKLKIVSKLLFVIYKLLGKKNRFDKQTEEKILNEYKTCDYIFQVAGFGISSQMAFSNSISRIWDIVLAKKLKKQITMMPQSIGPLNYKGIKKLILGYYLRKYINYPDFVLCREKMGKELLEKYGCIKAEIEHDLVLARPGDIDSGLIYSQSPERPTQYVIDKGKDIIIIPNFRLLKYRPMPEIREIFLNIINACINITDGKVCIFNHVNNDDRALCNSIYEAFDDNPAVYMIDGGFDCMETEKLLKKFALGIVCRWHSNVHAIRAGLPYVVIGWAEKYHETARYFENSDLIFDIRSPIIEKDIIAAVERVYNNRNKISGEIEKTANEIKKTFCLDSIIKDIMEEIC